MSCLAVRDNLTRQSWRQKSWRGELEAVILTLRDLTTFIISPNKRKDKFQTIRASHNDWDSPHNFETVAVRNVWLICMWRAALHLPTVRISICCLAQEGRYWIICGHVRVHPRTTFPALPPSAEFFVQFHFFCSLKFSSVILNASYLRRIPHQCLCTSAIVPAVSVWPQQTTF